MFVLCNDGVCPAECIRNECRTKQYGEQYLFSKTLFFIDICLKFSESTCNFVQMLFNLLKFNYLYSHNV